MASTNWLKAGVGRVDITPPIGTLLMGYGDPYKKRSATAVHDPLNATALVLQQGDVRAAIIELDIAIASDAAVAAIRDGVEKATGIPGKFVSPCSIQTHSAPRTVEVWGWNVEDVEYIQGQLIPGAIEAVKRAVAGAVPVRVGIGTVKSRTGINRRRFQENNEISLGTNHWGVIDPTMTVLRFESAKGTLVNLVHYGAHPTVYGAWNRLISRDWPGVMIDRVEYYTKAPTMFINGAVGDIAPRTNYDTAIGDNEVALMEAGTCAAIDAMLAWRGIKDYRQLDLSVLAETYELPYRPLPAMEVAQREFAASEANKGEPGGGMCNYLHWQAVIAEHSKPKRTGKPFLQTITAVGPVAFVPSPGEPFGETVMRQRDFSPFEHTLVASTSCGHNGYFCPRESLHRGGYEVWVAKAMGPYILAENIDDVLVAENTKLLRAAYQKMNPATPEA